MSDYGLQERLEPEQWQYVVKRKSHVAFLVNGLNACRAENQDEVLFQRDVENLLVEASLQQWLGDAPEMENDQAKEEQTELIEQVVRGVLIQGGRKPWNSFREEIQGDPRARQMLPAGLWEVLSQGRYNDPKVAQDVVMAERVVLSAEMVFPLLRGTDTETRSLREGVFEAIINEMGNDVTRFQGIPGFLKMAFEMRNQGMGDDNRLRETYARKTNEVDLTPVIEEFETVAVLIEQVFKGNLLIGNNDGFIWSLALKGELTPILQGIVKPPELVPVNIDEHLTYYARLVNQVAGVRRAVKLLLDLLGGGEGEGGIREVLKGSREELTADEKARLDGLEAALKQVFDLAPSLT